MYAACSYLKGVSDLTEKPGDPTSNHTDLLTWLKDQLRSQLNIPAVAIRFDAMGCMQKRTDEQSRMFTDGLERAELDRC
jgi:hypothetical protein